MAFKMKGWSAFTIETPIEGSKQDTGGVSHVESSVNPDILEKRKKEEAFEASWKEKMNRKRKYDELPWAQKILKSDPTITAGKSGPIDFGVKLWNIGKSLFKG